MAKRPSKLAEYLLQKALDVTEENVVRRIFRKRSGRDRLLTSSLTMEALLARLENFRESDLERRVVLGQRFVLNGSKPIKE